MEHNTILTEVEKKKHWERITQFLRRNVKICHFERKIEYYNKWIKVYTQKKPLSRNHFKKSRERWLYGNYKEYCKAHKKMCDKQINEYTEAIIKCKEKLSEEWGEYTEMCEQTFSDMCNGIINLTTEGIWLSYPKYFERKQGQKHWTMILSTGEKFETENKDGKRHLIKKLP